jgi:acetyl esterase/lipase
MTSEASQANRRHYEAAASRGAPRTPEDAIDWNEVHWGALTKEPQGVDYIEVTAAGAPALWLVPHGAVQDRVLFYAHGGGFVAGSIYTHRKMIAHIAKAVGCRALTFDYPYAHQQKYPAQLDTTIAVYRWLLDQKIKPEHIAVGCDSCGAHIDGWPASTGAPTRPAITRRLDIPFGLVGRRANRTEL